MIVGRPEAEEEDRERTEKMQVRDTANRRTASPIDGLFIIVGVLMKSVMSGATSAICPPQPMEAVEGGDVTLPCELYPSKNVSAYTVDWKRVDLNGIVYSYRHKKDHHDAQMERYTGRTTVNHDGLSRGNLTLRISSVQLNDSGRYRCFVPNLTARCFVNVSVVPKRIDDANTNGPPVEDDTEAHRDAAKERTSYAIAFPIVGLIVIVGVLVKRGMIKNRRRGQEGEMVPNNIQMMMNQAAEA
ncbi:uncharacterized protein LOC121889525 isoform X1 [Thunnus maccoyii]|uniref:uncharacterized protein LOC121889525 isoform X1 n=2 Tax=Thunnus maccoyii TaxID=8240 RepID=UPI001C4C0B84|nr:uncharacterized protein LOC121889525 isoform X1 [Thunnus maccoyii]